MSLRLSLPSLTQLHFIKFENRDFVDRIDIEEDIGISMMLEYMLSYQWLNYIENETTGSRRKFRLLWFKTKIAMHDSFHSLEVSFNF